MAHWTGGKRISPTVEMHEAFPLWREAYPWICLLLAFTYRNRSNSKFFLLTFPKGDDLDSRGQLYRNELRYFTTLSPSAALDLGTRAGLRTQAMASASMVAKKPVGPEKVSGVGARERKCSA